MIPLPAVVSQLRSLALSCEESTECNKVDKLTIKFPKFQVNFSLNSIFSNLNLQAIFMILAVIY